MKSTTRATHVRFSLYPVPPFRLDLTVWALRRRSLNLMDRWEDGVYRRALEVGGAPIAVSVSQDGARLRVEVESRTSAGINKRPIVAALDRILGLSVDLTSFHDFVGRDSGLKRLAKNFRGLKPPQFPTVFEALLNGISCQQLTITVGVTLLNRLSLAYGIPLEDGLRLFPRPQDLAVSSGADLRTLGYSRAKANAILAVAREVSRGRLDLEALRGRDDPSVMAELLAMPGVGPWTAGYVLLRGLGRVNVFPGGDIGAINSVVRFLKLKKPPDGARLGRILGQWNPYAGLIYIHLLLERLSESGALR